MTKGEIKQSVKMPEILSRYGLRPNRAGFICCPFHKEKSKKHNPVQDPNEIEQVEKNILMYETALKTFPPDSEEWYMCQFNLEKEKSRYEMLSAKSGGEKNS